MMIGQLERPFTRQKRTMSGDLDDYQPDIKAYRFLMSLFADNLNSSIRTHRDILGDVQLLPKVKICREEQFVINQQLQRVYKKIEDKISRDAIGRNSYLRKGYDQFLQGYYNIHPEKQIRCANHHLEVVVNDKFMLSNSPQKKVNINPATSPLKRPQSSKTEKPPGVVIATIDQAFNSFNRQVANIFKMKTINNYTAYDANPEHINRGDRKYLMTTTQRGTLRDQFSKTRRTILPKDKKPDAKRYQEDSSNMTFNGSQIVICDRRPKTHEDKQQQAPQSSSGSFRGKYSNKRILNIKMAHRKSIDEIERMQIENRLMMINSATTVNKTQSQGYKAKSRCWQNYFN